MKPLTVWRGHSTRPSFACWNSEEGQRAFAAWQAEQAHHANNEKQKAPTGAFLPRGTQSAGHGLFESALLLLHKIHAKQKEQHPHKVLLLVRPGGFEPLAFRVGELRHGSATRR